MPNFTAGTTFGANDTVTNTKLNNLIADATINPECSFGINSGTIGTLGCTRGTVATLNSTTGTIATLNSTTGTIPSLVATTLVTTGTGTATAPAIVPTGDTNTGIFFPASDTIAFSEGGAEAMRIDSSGNVGIGGTPSTLLHIQATSPSLRIQAASGNSGVLDFYRTASVNSGQIASESTNALVFSTNGVGNSGLAERLRIDSSGNVLVGTTSTDFSSGVGFKFLASATMPKLGIVINSADADSQYNFYNTNATNNGYRFYVNNNGGISNFSANNVNLSDERLKTNINLCGNYLDKICSIPVKTFNYKDQGEDTEKTIGVLAQEVEAHIPELVSNDGFGETPADGIPLKTIYQTDLQYVLMRCVQELKSENDSLKSRIEALEAV